MREREIRQGQVELTRNPIQSTLGSGEIFMAEPGRGEGSPRPEINTVEDTVRHLARVRVEGEKNLTLGPDGLPLEFGSWPLAFRSAWMEKQRDDAGNQLLTQAQEREDPHSISPAQQASLDAIYPIIQDDPEAFAASYKRAIDTLSEKRGEPIVHRDIDSLFEQTLQMVQGRISPEAEKRFRGQLRKIKDLTFAEATRKFEGLVKRIVKEPEAEPRRKAQAEARRDARTTVQIDTSGQTLVDEPTGDGEEMPPDVVLTPSFSALPTGEPLTEVVVDGVGSGGGRVPPIETATAAPEPEEEPEDEAPVAPITPEVAETVEPVVVSEPEVVDIPAPEVDATGPVRPEPTAEENVDNTRSAFDRLSDVNRLIIDRAISDATRGDLDPEMRAYFREIAAKGVIDSSLSRQMRVLDLGSREHRDQIGVPNSLEDLAELIMKSSAPEWSRDGTKALISEDENGKDKVNVVNFLDWARNNMYRIHDANPTSPINFFSDIGTSVRNDVYGSQISFYEIVFTDSIWLDKTMDGGKKAAKENKDYQALRNQMLMETFLFSAIRNPDVTWSVTRGSKDSMQKAIAEAMTTNPLTRSKFFEFIFTMPSMHRKSLNELGAESGTEMQAKTEGNFFMGDAAREALAVYMNISNYEQLVKLLGPNAALFKINYEDWDLTKGERHKDDAGNYKPDKPIAPDVDEDPKDRKKWFNPDGTVKLGKRNVLTRKWEPSMDGRVGVPDPDYMKYINVFLTPMPDQRQQGEVRTRIILSIMEKNGLSFREAQLAELWAYSMTHTNGVAADMDTDAVAFDYLTRFLRFKEKRKRDRADKRTSPFGGKYNLEGLKRIGLTFFEAAKDIRGRSIQSIIQGGVGRDIGIENMPLKANVDFEWDYVRNGDGDIVFKDKSGTVADKKVKTIEVKDREFVYLDVEGQKVDVKGFTPQKSSLIFRDFNGNIVDIRAKITQYKISKQGEVVYRDASGKQVHLPKERIYEKNSEGEVIRSFDREYKPKVTIVDVDNPVEFKADLQKQFVPNHVSTGVKAYDWIMSEVGLRLPKLIEGYDSRGNPIINREELNKIKDGIAHDLRYILSTWAEINYGETEVRCEKVEVRDDKGRLIAKDKLKKPTGKKDEDGNDIYEKKDQYLDDDWYILDEHGKRTDVKSEPDTYLVSREMTILESMFGVDALKYIQYEITRQGLSATEEQKKDRVDKIIPIEEYGRKGKEKMLLDLTNWEEDNFKTAVWQGVFDYVIAAEIESHRDHKSGYERYDAKDMKRASDALIAGELTTPDRANFIKEKTGTTAPRLYAEDVGFAFAAGGLEGFWQSILLIAKNTVK